MTTELIRKASAQELVSHRDRALEMAKRGAELIIEAQQTAAKASPNSMTAGNLSRNTLSDIGGLNGTPDSFLEAARKEWDAAVWRHLIEFTGLGGLMDAKSKQDFMRQLNEDPPNITVDNIVATLTDLGGRSQEIFEKGIVQAFSGLSWSFKTNEPFRLKDKVIIEFAFDEVSGREDWMLQHFHHFKKDTVRDVERVFRVLDGQEPLPGYGGIVGNIDEVCRSKGPWPREAENEYFHAKWFKKGTLHLTFKRPDLVRKANEMIARHFGEVLADAS